MVDDKLVGFGLFQVKYFHLILVVRWASALLYTTEFVPDEAWQSTEVAYYYTYG